MRTPESEHARDQASKSVAGRDTILPSWSEDSHPDVSRQTSSVPKTFGRYRILKLLGQGGMGSVYLAHDTELDRKVALKIPKFRESDSNETIERFYREARSSATLRSAHICPIYDVGEIASDSGRLASGIAGLHATGTDRGSMEQDRPRLRHLQSGRGVV